MVPLAQLAFLDVGAQEMAVILVVALLIFGGRLPEVARNLGKTVGEFKRSAQNLTREFRHDLTDLPPSAYKPPPAIQQWRDAAREDVPPEEPAPPVESGSSDSQSPEDEVKNSGHSESFGPPPSSSKS